MHFQKPAMADSSLEMTKTLIFVLVLLGVGLAKDIRLVRPNRTEYQFNDNAKNCQNSYTLHMNAETFRGAMDYCQKNGGVLAPQNDREVNALATAASSMAPSLNFVWMRGSCREKRINSPYSYFTQCTTRNAFICKKVLEPKVIGNSVDDVIQVLKPVAAGDTANYTVQGGADRCPGEGGTLQAVDSNSPNTIYSLMLMRKTFEEARQHCQDIGQEMVKLNHDSTTAINEVIQRLKVRCPKIKYLYNAVWDDGTCMGKNTPSHAKSYWYYDCNKEYPFVCKEPKGVMACLPSKKNGYSFKTSSHSYVMFTEKKSNHAAKDHCRNIGGQLAPWEDSMKKSLEDFVNCQCVGNKWESGPLWTGNSSFCDAYWVITIKGNNIPFTKKHNSPCNATLSFVCKYDSQEHGVQYKLGPQKMSLDNAVRYCEGNGGSLASMDTDKEAVLSTAKAKELGGKAIRIWNSYRAQGINNPKSEFMNSNVFPGNQRNGFICRMDITTGRRVVDAA